MATVPVLGFAVAELDGETDVPVDVPALGCWLAVELERVRAGGEAVRCCGELVRTSAKAMAPAAATASAAALITAARGRRDRSESDETGGRAEACVLSGSCGFGATRGLG